MTGAEEDAWSFLAVCVPIVVFFAPFGSFLASHFHRQVLAALIYILDSIALVRTTHGTKKKVILLKLFFQITAFVVIPMTINRGILCGSLLCGGFIFFLCISKLGEKLLEINEAKEQKNDSCPR